MSPKHHRENGNEQPTVDGREPDVLLDIPALKVEEIDLELDHLRAKLNLHTRVLDMVDLSVGVDAYLGRVSLTISGVEAQVLLKVRLDNVTAIVQRVLESIDHSPELVERLVAGLAPTLTDLGHDAGHLLGDGLDPTVGTLAAYVARATPRVPDALAGATARAVGPASHAAALGRSERRTARRAEAAVKATAAARRKSEDMGVDLTAVTGSGRDGQVTVRDVVRSAT